MRDAITGHQRPSKALKHLARRVRDAGLQRHEQPKQVQVECNRIEDVRPLNLDGDLPPVGELSFVHLSDRGASEAS